MNLLTRNIGKGRRGITIDPARVKRVLISRPNGRLGNQLLLTPLVEEVCATFPGCKVDLFVKGFLGPVLFKNYTQVEDFIRLPGKPFKELRKYIKVWFRLRSQKYDLVINAIDHSSSGRLSAMLARGRAKSFGDVVPELRERYPDYVHMAKFPVYNFRHFIAGLGMETPPGPVKPMNIMLSKEELANGKAVMDGIVPGDKKSIAIYTFATGDKCLTPEWWGEMYGRMTERYGRMTERYGDRYNIFEVLPMENVSQIGFAAPSYYSRDIREIAAVCAHAEVFLTADCGIMHLASASGVPVVSLFSITSIDLYQPYNRGSVALKADEVSVDQILVEIDKALAL